MSEINMRYRLAWMSARRRAGIAAKAFHAEASAAKELELEELKRKYLEAQAAGKVTLVPSERFVVPLEDPHDALEAIVDAFWDEAKSAGKETPDGRALVLTRTFLDDLAERIAAGLIKGAS